MGITSLLRDFLVKDFDPDTSALYRTCVAAARQPVFYENHGVPDSLDGRFDLLLLHVVLVMLSMQDADAKQRLFDLMFADMDRSLREMGVGDMSIAKKMKPMLAGFYGRAEAYQQALSATTDDKLIAALSRNLYGQAEGIAPHAASIANYARETILSLHRLDATQLGKGDFSFPAP